VVGLPGAGKTTVVDALISGREPVFRLIRLKRFQNAWLVALSALCVAVPFFSQFRQIRRRRWVKFWLMVQVTALARIVSRDRTSGPVVLLLDQGPAYMLGILQRLLSDEAGRNGAAFERFWTTSIDSWTRILDLVVYLDASDDVLYHRIGGRHKRHRVKELGREEASERFRSWRDSRHLILEQLQLGRESKRSVYADTGVQSVNEIRRRILARVNAAASYAARPSRSDDPASVMDGSLPSS
jgi:hypothetical protein